MSKAYVGIDKFSNAIPGVVVILPNKRMFFRQIGDGKADRILAPQLLAILDRALIKLGKTPPKVGLRRGYGPSERTQLTVDLAAGYAKPDADDGGFAGTATLGLFYPLARHVMPGVQVHGMLGPTDAAGASLALKLRRSFFGDLGELSLTGDAGVTTGTDLTAGGQLAAQFAITGGFAVRLHLGARYLAIDDGAVAATAGLGVAFLF